MLVTVRFRVVIAPETLIDGSVNDVVALALLLGVLESGLPLLTEAVLLVLPCAAIDATAS